MTFFNVMSLSLMILSWSYFLFGQLKKNKECLVEELPQLRTQMVEKQIKLSLMFLPIHPFVKDLKRPAKMSL
jgi:hypothetical protein